MSSAHPKIIKKPKSYFKKIPNLENYSKTYRKFKYSNYHHELEWFPDGKLNAAHNAVDRHSKTWRANKVALYWQGADGDRKSFTYRQLMQISNQFANVVQNLGASKGDRVFFFLPRIPELYYGFLGTLKTGAIAGTLFSAFGPEAIKDRVGSSDAKILVTTEELFQRVKEIRQSLDKLEKVIIVDRDESSGNIFSLKQEIKKVSNKFKVREMNPKDPAFMLYTSGTTGKPKGVIHTHYAILHEHLTAKWVLDIQEDDTFWCTADPGWVTGIAYNILGTWSTGASSVVYEGRFNPKAWYQILEDYNVSIWYTAPTAIRLLMKHGKKLAKSFDTSALRHLCSVGEPLNPEAVWWGLKAFGLPFHDNWWQTETGGILIANYPGMPIKPGSMGKPFPGIKAGIVDDLGRRVRTGQEGNLVLRPNWPSMMCKIWRRPKKYGSYFITKGGKKGLPKTAKARKKVWYVTGDRAFRDKSGYYWFVGRADDVIKTAGERVGPFEVESALITHPEITEAGVIGKPDEIYGEIIKAFVVAKEPEKWQGKRATEKLQKILKRHVKKTLAGHAYPREIEVTEALPKTRSGKIMRRLLKAQELGLPLGDTSTVVY